MLKERMAKLAVAAVLAVGLVPGVAFAADQVDDQFVAATLEAQTAPEAIDYDGDDVVMVKEDLKEKFGMLSATDTQVSLDADGKVHITFTPSNRTVYGGFYLNAAAADDDESWQDDNFIAAIGSADYETLAFDFTVDESYCGKAWPIAPLKVDPSASGKSGTASKTTSAQYYLAIPAKDKIAAETTSEIAVENDVKMFKPLAESTLEKVGDNATLVFALDSASFAKAFVGTADEAAKAAKDAVIAFNEDDKTFRIPVADQKDGKAFTMSFFSVNKQDWYERSFTLDADKGTLKIESVEEEEEAAETTFMFRLYNPYTYEHFYTADEAERDGLIELGWIDEGVGWTAPNEGTPVYRLYNSYAWDHHYTMDEQEVKDLVAEGWEDEGLRWYSDDDKTVAVYREYNPNEYRCNHNYTSDKVEHDGLVEIGWTDEKIGWYGVQNNDEANAAYVDSLIAKIQVQARTDTTDADCAAARAAWDKLTDKQKELVEEADYFGLDTGDASKDDPLADAPDKENEILVVSFGTSFNDSRVADIKGIEDAIAKANPDWCVRRAFTAQIIINHIQARDGEKINNMDQALELAAANGVKTLVIQPTHLMHGAEYDEMVEAAKKYESKMTIKIAEPLLGEVGATADDVNADKEAVAKAAVAAAVADAKYDSLEKAAEEGVAFVFMGHGTEHDAKITYEQMQKQMADLGYANVYIGTVEGEPESTDCENVIEAVKADGYKTVVLRPLMVVAGDHANNDMADPDDNESWYSQFTASKAFDKVDCQIKGLGEIEDIQAIYVEHAKAAIA